MRAWKTLEAERATRDTLSYRGKGRFVSFALSVSPPFRPYCFPFSWLFPSALIRTKYISLLWPSPFPRRSFLIVILPPAVPETRSPPRVCVSLQPAPSRPGRRLGLGNLEKQSIPTSNWRLGFSHYRPPGIPPSRSRSRLRLPRFPLTRPRASINPQSSSPCPLLPLSCSYHPAIFQSPPLPLRYQRLPAH